MKKNKIKLSGIVGKNYYVGKSLHFILYTIKGDIVCVLNNNTRLYAGEEVEVRGNSALYEYRDFYNNSYIKEIVSCKVVRKISKTERLKIECSEKRVFPIKYVNTVMLQGLVEKINKSTKKISTTQLLLLVKSDSKSTDRTAGTITQRFNCTINHIVDFNRGDEVRVVGELRVEQKDQKSAFEILCISCLKLYKICYTSTYFEGLHYQQVEASSVQEAKQRFTQECWHLKEIVSVN